MPQRPEVLQAVNDPNYHVRRVHFSEFSVEAFRSHSASSQAPLIIQGLGKYLCPEDPRGLGLPLLCDELAGDCGVPLRGEGMVTWEAFCQQLGKGQSVYLADASVA
eukprot:3632934-Amphidinium_carterae.1